MFAFLWTALSGWIATAGFGAGATLPFVLRELRILGMPRKHTMRAHYTLGFAVPALALFHAWLPMSAGHMRGFDQTRLWLATLALVFLFVQLALGLELRAPQPRARSVRLIHLGLMIVLGGLIAAHIVLNRA